MELTPPLDRADGSRKTAADRFISPRSAMKYEVSFFEVMRGADGAGADVDASPAKEEYKKTLAAGLFGGRPVNRILNYREPEPRDEGEPSSLRVLYNQNRKRTHHGAFRRHVPQYPQRILDAPELTRDFYLNLLDWSPNNQIAIALDDSIYLWNDNDGSIKELMRTKDAEEYVSSLSWCPEGTYMAVGVGGRTSDHKVQLWDVDKMRQVRSMKGHRARVASLAWNGPCLSSGGFDSIVLHHDVRVAEHEVGCLRGHRQEVCGLKWAPSGQKLASGGNDNIVNVWDDRFTSPSGTGNMATNDTPLFRFDAHQAAVKALAWCPWRANLLASGGGTQDRMIRFWNTQTGTCLQEIDTKSQVCALQWAKHEKEIVSAHGYAHNQVALWKYPSMVKIADLTGHVSRVLHMAQSPDGRTVATASEDETLRFWKILPGDKAMMKANAAARDSVFNSKRMAIR